MVEHSAPTDDPDAMWRRPTVADRDRAPSLVDATGREDVGPADGSSVPDEAGSRRSRAVGASVAWSAAAVAVLCAATASLWWAGRGATAPPASARPAFPTSIVERWSTTVDDAFVNNPVAVGDVVAVVGGLGTDLVALDRATGDLLWSADVGSPNSVSALRVVDDLLVVDRVTPLGDPSIVVFDPTDGRRLWASELPGGRVLIAFESIFWLGDVDGSERLVELAASDGATLSTVTADDIGFTTGGQFVARTGTIQTWYEVSSLAVLAGPVDLATSTDFGVGSLQPPQSVAIDGRVVMFDEPNLRVFDGAGAEVASVEVGARIQAVVADAGGDTPTVILSGYTSSQAFSLIDDELVEIWDRSGERRFVEVVGGRTFLALTSPSGARTDVVAGLTGATVLTADKMFVEAAGNGFLTRRWSTDEQSGVVTARDPAGGVVWELDLGQRRHAVVDGGILASVVDLDNGSTRLTYFE